MIGPHKHFRGWLRCTIPRGYPWTWKWRKAVPLPRDGRVLTHAEVHASTMAWWQVMRNQLMMLWRHWTR